MPVVHPAEVWKESGRYYKIGPELLRFKDRTERDMVLAMTHEEVVAILLRDIVQSYRQLPMMVYHFQTKFRDEPRPRGGLIRVREFVMKDAYSCDRDDAGLDVSYRDQYEAYERIFKRLGLDAIAVGADVGIMGGPGAHEFMVLNDVRRGHARPVRQVRLRRQPADRRASASPTRSRRTPCRWRTSRRPARRRSRRSRRSSASPSRRPRRPRSSSPATAGSSSRSSAATTTSTRRSSSTRSRRPAGSGRRRSRRSRRAGMQAGYGSPIGAKDSVVVVDELVVRSPNLVAGANRVGWHVKNVNVPRDYTPDLIAEITKAREGDPCIRCGSPVKLRKGIEVGNIFKLGTDFTDAFGSMYLGEDGERHPIVMGSYGIGLGRNVACIVEAHHDEKGIAWPDEVAPYAAHLVAIGAAKDRSVTRGRRAAPRRSPQDAGIATSCTTTATSRPA